MSPRPPCSSLGTTDGLLERLPFNRPAVSISTTVVLGNGWGTVLISVDLACRCQLLEVANVGRDQNAIFDVRALEELKVRCAENSSIANVIRVETIREQRSRCGRREVLIEKELGGRVDAPREDMPSRTASRTRRPVRGNAWNAIAAHAARSRSPWKKIAVRRYERLRLI